MDTLLDILTLWTSNCYIDQGGQKTLIHDTLFCQQILYWDILTSGHCSDIIYDGHKYTPSKDIIMSIFSHLDSGILELNRTANSITRDGPKDTYS